MTTTAADARLLDQVTAERRDLLEVLTSLPEASWDLPTLCAGWRVRELVAHLTMPLRWSTPRFVAELARSGGRFHAMADRVARRDGAAPTSVLIEGLRANLDNPWQPPGGGLAGALTHDVVHGLDVTVALGLGRRVPADRLRVVLDAVTEPRSLRHFGTDLAGVQLRADDLDWTFGSGTPRTGAAQHLVLLLCGRQLPPDLLA